MTAFNYTSGNPSNLTPGGAASMGDIQGPFTDLRTFLNAGVLDETNVPNLAAAFTTWKPTGWATGSTVPTLGGAGTSLMPGGVALSGAPPASVLAAGTAVWTFYLDPADYTANARATRYRIRWTLMTNNVAPATTFNCGLYPVTSVGAASGSSPAVGTIGAVVAGSVGQFALPAASTALTPIVAEFAPPSAGYYVFGMANAGFMAAGSQVVIGGILQYRQA